MPVQQGYEVEITSVITGNTVTIQGTVFRYAKCPILLTADCSESGEPHYGRQNVSDLKKELETEMLNGLLFASDEGIQNLANFIRNPSYPLYVKTAASMIRDLWGRKTRISEEILTALDSRPVRSR